MLPIIFFLNLLHLFVLIFPILIFIRNIPFVNRNIKWILLFYICIPIHWIFLNNGCISTEINVLLGDFENTKTEARFSEKYLRWFYQPILNSVNLSWNNTNLNNIVTLHTYINIILIWVYCFFYK